MPNYIDQKVEEFEKGVGVPHSAMCDLKLEGCDKDCPNMQSRKFLKEALTDLLLKCKEAVPPERKEMLVWGVDVSEPFNKCRSTTLQNLDNLEK